MTRYCPNFHENQAKVAMVYVSGHEAFYYCPICESDKILPEEMPAQFRTLTDPDDEELVTTFGPIETEDKPANPKQAYGDKKVPLHLVPPVVDIYAALAAWEGAVKYGPYNYREIPVEIMTYIGAAKRHLNAMLDGEWMDPGYWEEVNGEMMWFPPKPHISGVIMCMGIIADCHEIGNLIDNRPPKGNANEMLERWKKDNRPGPTDFRRSDGVSGEEVDSDSELGERSRVPHGWMPNPHFK